MKLGKMKKILAALTAGVLCMGAVPLSAASLPEAVLSVSAAESTYENLTYTTEEDGTVTITGCSADVSGDVELPAEIGGKSVTRIGDSAFQATPPLQAFPCRTASPVSAILPLPAVPLSRILTCPRR